MNHILTIAKREVRGYFSRTKFFYDECHKARTVRLHLIHAFKGHLSDVAVGAQRRGSLGSASPVEGLPQQERTWDAL